MTVPKDCTVPPELQRTLTHKRVPPDLHRDPRSVAAELASDWGRSRQLYEKVADVIGGMDEHDLARFSQVNANASVDILDIPALHGALEVPLDIPALNLKVLLLANLEGCHSKHVHATVNAGTEFFRKVLRDLLDVKTGRPQLPQEFEAKLAQLQGNCGNRDAHEAEGNYDEQDHFQAEVDHSLPHSLTHSLPHSLTHSLPHPLPPSLPHSGRSPDQGLPRAHVPLHGRAPAARPEHQA